MFCSGIVEEIVLGAVQQSERCRTAEVFSQLDAPVRDWVLGQRRCMTLSDQ